MDAYRETSTDVYAPVIFSSETVYTLGNCFNNLTGSFSLSDEELHRSNILQVGESSVPAVMAHEYRSEWVWV